MDEFNNTLLLEISFHPHKEIWPCFVYVDQIIQMHNISGFGCMFLLLANAHGHNFSLASMHVIVFWPLMLVGSKLLLFDYKMKYCDNVILQLYWVPKVMHFHCRI
jgi:hypothetical protein